MRCQQFTKGDEVAYTAPHNPAHIEHGTVTSTTTRWVYVRYEARQRSQATHPDNLTLYRRDGQMWDSDLAEGDTHG